MQNLFKKIFLISISLILIFVYSCKDKGQKTEPKDSMTIVEKIDDLYVGETIDLKIESTNTVTITTEQNDLVRIDGYKITALKEGLVNLVFSLNDLKETRQLNIINPYINVIDQSMFVGDSLNFASFIESNVSDKLTITSSNPSALQINQDSVTALSEGDITLDVVFKHNELELSKTVNFKIIDKSIASFTTNTIPTSFKVGDSFTIVIAKKYAEDTITISSSDSSVLSVDDNTLKALKKGTIKLVLESQLTGYKVEKSITVSYVSPSFSTNDIPSSITVNDTFTIQITKVYSSDTITISSSSTSILDVDGNKITALSEGTAKLTLTSTLTGDKIEKTITVSYPWPTDTVSTSGIYLGVKNYGSVKASSGIQTFIYKFNIDGEVKEYKLKKVGDYELHNYLEEGNLYELTIDDNTITNLIKCDLYTNKLVEGKLNSFNGYTVVVNDQTYDLLKTAKSYKITKKAGGATLSSCNLTVGNNVIIHLSSKGYVINIYESLATKKYESTLNPIAGERTLTNFFKIALSAVGHALYVYGGAWDYQDVGSSIQARSIGVADSWVEFFYEQDATYNYKNTTQSSSYYPFGSYNEYYYAGVDCSGFVGWVMYNLMNTTSGNSGYVMGSNKMAKTFAEYGYGTYTKSYSAPTSNICDFKPGDIISCTGHVWICLGVCTDGSMVIIHSTPSTSYSGYNGGGAQLGAIGSNENCEAYKLADKYNKQYFVDWSSRYPTSLKSYSSYLAQGNSNNGKFSWYLNSNGVLDPDGLSNKLPDEILKILFDE